MADDLTLDEGAGAKKAATDEVVAGRHIPWVKIASGTDDATDGAIVDASGNLQVEVTNGSIAGTAGTPNAGVLSVQGVGSGTTLPVTEASAAAIKTAAEAIAAAVATEGDALGDGVLLQGDDGTDRTNVLVDTSGHVQVDVLSAPSTTVTATHLDVRHLNTTDDAVVVADGGNTITVDNGGTFAVQAAQATAANLNCTEASASAIKTAAELIDDAVYVDDADWTDNTSKHILTGGLYQSAPHTVTDGDVSPMQVDVGGRTIVVGPVAADGAAAGNPVLLAGKAFDTGAPTDMSADGDVAALLVTRAGRQYVETSHPNRWSANSISTSTPTDLEVVAAPAAGFSLYVTDIIISVLEAGSVKLEFDTASAKSVIAGPYYFAANGGLSMAFHTPIKCTAAKNLGVTAVTSAHVIVTVCGHTAAG